MKRICCFIVSLTVLCCAAQERVYDILTYGAKGDGQTDNTRAILQAIDAAAMGGGGTVKVPAGKFITGVLRLRSGIHLYLAEGAVLLGSAKRADYGAGSASALIVADDQQDVSITGKGTIDGQALALLADIYRMLNAGTLEDKEWKEYNPWHQMRPEERNRPKIIEFRRCRGVQVRGITIRDGLCWIQNYKECTDMVIDSIRVRSTTFWNNDGIDLVDCRKVRVTNSFIDAADDGICLKSENAQSLCDDIYIAHCTIRSSASAFKLGTASHGGFSNIKVRDLTIYDTYRSAIALESVDGAVLENIDIRNIRATNTGNAIFLRLGHRKQSAPVGMLRHVYIGDVRAEIPAGKPDKGYEMEGPTLNDPHNVFPSSVAGIPGHPVQDVTLENIDITYAGGGSRDTAFFSPDSLARVPEREASYPEFSMFGELPASGFYARHVQGLQLKNWRIHYKKSDFRPVAVFDDVSGLTLGDIHIPEAKALPVILLHTTDSPVLSNIQLAVPLEKGIRRLTFLP